ncbi:BT4734/BF3469 family protein [Bacteroides sp.]|uniref:BT4734/BF3469 family protein n=1 Tax=Bacteroides sp. TaxID=29523 RepID=UPI00260A7F58|nr:BT4734/BF3469 family protein [Bacteroides sp.]MDD3038160.1 BT4734/BF3469 family protein [Bacteroides sp.]
MTNILVDKFKMSYFMSPIAPIRDERGRTVTPATLIPFCEVSVEQIHQMITCNEDLKVLTEQVRGAADMRAAKSSLLPYVTPCGIFTRRNGKCLVSSSGLVIVDIDHLESYEEAVEMRHALFDDPFLCPVLTFISPSGRGVKAFVPYRAIKRDDEIKYVTENMIWAMQYVELTYGSKTELPSNTPAKGVDISGKDIVRACFLSHDPEALFRKL